MLLLITDPPSPALPPPSLLVDEAVASVNISLTPKCSLAPRW